MNASVNAERLDPIILTWLWYQHGKPAKQTAIVTAMKPLLPDGSATPIISESLDRLVASGQVQRIAAATKKGAALFAISPDGQARAAEFIGRNELPAAAKPFTALANIVLPAKAIGLTLPDDNKKSQAAFGKLVPVAVCARALKLDLPLDAGPDAAKVTLVKLALAKSHGIPIERLHLKKLPAGELPALVAAPLLGAAGSAVTNLDKLLEATAQRVLHVTKPTQIKSAIVRDWLVGQEAKTASDSPPARADTSSSIDAANFAHHVQSAAKSVAQSQPDGVNNLGDQVLIHYCWREFQRAFGDMPLALFKQRLAQANGRDVVLVREDLIPEDRAGDFAQAEIRVGTTSYHYVRIER